MYNFVPQHTRVAESSNRFRFIERFSFGGPEVVPFLGPSRYNIAIAMEIIGNPWVYLMFLYWRASFKLQISDA